MFFLIPSDLLAAMVGPVSSYCIVYIVVVFVFVVLWTHESGIKIIIIYINKSNLSPKNKQFSHRLGCFANTILFAQSVLELLY